MYNTAYGFHDYYYNCNEAKQGRLSTYALAMGAYLYSEEKFSGNVPCYGTTFWWLRSPGDDLREVADLNYDGEITLKDAQICLKNALKILE